MDLRTGVIDTRSKLGEGNPWLFTDADIVRALNMSAQKMCSAAQSIRNTFASVTKQPTPDGNGNTVGQQEYFLPEDCEQPIWVRTQIGILFPTTASPQEQLQIGGYVSSVPLACYFRKGTYLTGQIPVTNNSPTIAGGSEKVFPPPDTTGQLRYIVGFYPVPANAYPFFVDYYAYHPQMQEPLDQCYIPPMFMDPWTSYAAQKGFEKQGDLESAAYHKQLFEAGAQEFRDYQALLNLQATPAKYGGSMMNPLFNRGPSVLILAPTNPMIDS